MTAKKRVSIMKNKRISLDYAGWHEVTEGPIRGLSKPPFEAQDLRQGFEVPPKKWTLK